MLTNNFLHSLSNARGIGANNLISTKQTNGNEGVTLSFGTDTNYFCSSTLWSKYSKFIIGSGTTKPKMTDYCLENKITESYDCSILDRRCVIGEEMSYLKITGNITNTGTEDLSFSEIGWVIASGAALQEFMLAREVYDTPITIAPGESVAVNVNII